MSPSAATAEPVSFDALSTTDLFVDRVYAGGRSGNVSDDPIQYLLPVGNQGGFRYKGSVQKDDVRIVVLYTSGENPDWPDVLDPLTGTLTYFGDNKTPGRPLHDTQRHGNEILRMMFDRAHSGGDRSRIPPVFVFSKARRGRDVVFKGLAVPGALATPSGGDLVAIWRMAQGERFQNYRAIFTILDEALVTRQWIDDILRGNPVGGSCPDGWLRWVRTGSLRPLISERIDIRSKAEQMPATLMGRRIVEAVQRYFTVELGVASRFEECSVNLWRMMAPSTGEVDLTRPWRDGGRDAIGAYYLGPQADRLAVEFALEAKCYGLNSSVGVREMSRLISRLRFRQFGVFVTTSHFNSQVYHEVRDDKHPVVLVCARDIVEILASNGIATDAAVRRWLKDNYPP